MDASDRARWLRVAGVVGAGAAVLGLVVLGLWMSDPNRRLERAVRDEEVVSSFRTPGRSVDPAEVWVARSEAVLEDLRRDREALRREVEALRSQVSDLSEQARNPGPSPARRVSATGNRPAPDTRVPDAPVDLPPPTPLPLPPDPGAGASPDGVMETAARRAAARRLDAPPAGPPRDDILVVEVSRSASAEGGEDAAPPSVRDYLPAGSFAGAVLLSGLDAPTGGLGRSNPQPVLLRLEDNGTLPNRFRSQVRECFVTAAGFGDLSSERAYLRLERLSCVTHEGTVLDRPVKGFVAGEDGKAGLRGRVVEKRGQYLAKTLLAGTLGGIGRGISQSVSNVSTSALGSVQTVDSGDILEFGAAQGVGNALEKLADWYLKRADELYPVIEVDAARHGDVVLTEGLELDVDLWEQDS